MQGWNPSHELDVWLLSRLLKIAEFYLTCSLSLQYAWPYLFFLAVLASLLVSVWCPTEWSAPGPFLDWEQSR